ncbi:MAG: hypothetical protein AAF813_06285, partial [Pseudomonadota bacterium]
MTILTAMLVIVGVGAVLQRGENGSSLLGSGGSFQSNPDTFALRAGRVQSLDVLLNDRNVERVNAEELTIVTAPACGTAQVVGGAIQYSDSAACLGEVSLTYCVPWDGSCKATDVVLDIVQVNQNNTVVSAATGPAVLDVVTQGVIADEPAAVAQVQPRRMTVPTGAEIVTPNQATADVRAIALADAPSAVLAPETKEAAVSVAKGSARSGSVGVVGATLNMPQITGESSGVQIASAAQPEELKPTFVRPKTVKLGARLGQTKPQAEVAFTPPTRPDAAPVVVMEELQPMPGQTVVVAEETPDEAAPVVAAVPAPATLAPTSDEPEVRSADAAESDDGSAPATLSTQDTLQIAEDAPEVVPSAPSTLTADVVIEPAEAAPAVVASPADVPAQAVPIAPVEEEIELAIALPQAAPTPVAVEPATPVEVVTEEAPEAQVREPLPVIAPVEDTPEDSGVLASLARSNTVFGATVSAAK